MNAEKAVEIVKSLIARGEEGSARFGPGTGSALDHSGITEEEIEALKVLVGDSGGSGS